MKRFNPRIAGALCAAALFAATGGVSFVRAQGQRAKEKAAYDAEVAAFHTQLNNDKTLFQSALEAQGLKDATVTDVVNNLTGGVSQNIYFIRPNSQSQEPELRFDGTDKNYVAVVVGGIPDDRSKSTNLPMQVSVNGESAFSSGDRAIIENLVHRSYNPGNSKFSLSGAHNPKNAASMLRP